MPRQRAPVARLLGQAVRRFRDFVRRVQHRFPRRGHDRRDEAGRPSRHMRRCDFDRVP